MVDALKALMRFQTQARGSAPKPALPLAEAPGHTNLMIPPENIPDQNEYYDTESFNRQLIQDDDAAEYDRLLDESNGEFNARPSDSPIANILEGVSISLDPSQESAVRGLAQCQYGCLIGAAGTGKTTTTRYLLNTLINGDPAYEIAPVRLERVNVKDYHKKAKEVSSAGDSDEEDASAEQKGNDDDLIPSIAMVAFTGQATQVLKRNMPKTWRKNVMTIHSLLGFAPAEYVKANGQPGMRFEPTYTTDNRMPWDIILVDEASMVNLDLWHMLLDASKESTRFYFVGDLNQLPPPIGLGILGFALAKWPVFELTVVHRQKDEAANRIVDTAWRILQGKAPEFDDPAKNPNWRVIGFTLPHDSQKAHSNIIALAKGLSEKKVDASVDPARPAIYDPWRDRIMTPMNGYNDDDPASLLGQYPLNDALSRIFADPKYPRILIDAKKAKKRFAVGYRVMATKNESPNAIDRVTNGLTGRIVEIEENPDWIGDRRLVGAEDWVSEQRSLMLDQALNAAPGERATAMDLAATLENFNLDVHAPTEEEEKQGGPASHIVTVKFDNGATRAYKMNAQIEQLQIAYASTTHKAQGAEMPTAIVVVHHASKRMLCRENLYTAVTRASQRLIILYTDFGMRLALTNQKVTGNDLPTKIKQYIRLLGGDDGNITIDNMFKVVNVRLTHED